MMGNNKNLIIIFLVLALFTGSTIEMAEGFTHIGIVLLVMAAILVTQVKLTKSAVLEGSMLYVSLGIFIIFADLFYNFGFKNNFGTLDTMALFFGISMVACGINRPSINHIGEFGAYISATFMVLFLIFYSVPYAFNIDFMLIFNHYCILLPTVAIMNLGGISLEIISMATARLSGFNDIVIYLAGSCAGLYSMFLLLGIALGYIRMEHINKKKAHFLMAFTIVVAYIANLVRVIILYLTAYFYGAETMMLVHTHIGWIIFAVVAGGIMYLINLKK